MLGSDIILLGLKPLDPLSASAEPRIPRVGSVNFKDVSSGDFRFGIVIRSEAVDVHPVFVPLDFFHKRVNAHVIVVTQGSTVRVNEHLAKPSANGVTTDLVAQFVNQRIADERTVEIIRGV